MPTDCAIDNTDGSVNRRMPKLLDKKDSAKCKMPNSWDSLQGIAQTPGVNQGDLKDVKTPLETYNAYQAIGAWIYGGSEAVRPLYEVEGVSVKPYKQVFEYKVDGSLNDLVYLQVKRTSDRKGIINLGSQLGSKAFLLSRYSSPTGHYLLDLLPRTFVNS
jgi:hypothetical protein